MSYFMNMDAGHYIGRQHGPRFNEKNCHAQCTECNTYNEGRKDKYFQFIIDRYGKDAEIMLQASKHTKRPGKIECLAVIQEYRLKAHQELIKRDVEEPYWVRKRILTELKEGK